MRHYIIARREDAELARDKLAYLRNAALDDIQFGSITPDAKRRYWLDQSDGDFARLDTSGESQTKLAKTAAEEQAVFGLYSLGVSTNRDEWVYDFDADHLGRKVRTFINDHTNEVRATDHGWKSMASIGVIRGASSGHATCGNLRLDMPNRILRESIRQAMFIPFVCK